MFFCNYTIRIQSLRLAMCAMIAAHDDDVDDEDDDDLGDDDEDDDDLGDNDTLFIIPNLNIIILR